MSNVFGKSKAEDRIASAGFSFLSEAVWETAGAAHNASMFVILMHDRIVASWPRVETRGSVNRQIASRDTVQKFGVDKQAEARENSEAADRRTREGTVCGGRGRRTRPLCAASSSARVSFDKRIRPRVYVFANSPL